MNHTEWEIIRPLMSRVIRIEWARWDRLKEEVESGPYFVDWPGYVSALEMQDTAKRLVHGLPTTTKGTLLAEGRKRAGRPESTEAEILDRYAAAVVEKIVTRAEGAVRRGSWQF